MYNGDPPQYTYTRLSFLSSFCSKHPPQATFTVKKRKLFLHFCGILPYIWRMIPSAVRGIFLLPPTVFFASDRPGSPSINQEGFFPAYRMGIGKNSDMVGKIPPWRWDMVGKIPTQSEKFRHGRNKRLGGVHEGIINQVIFIYYCFLLNFLVPCPVVYNY